MFINNSGRVFSRKAKSISADEFDSDEIIPNVEFPKVIGVIGAGSFGIVYLVKYSAESSPLALKAEFGVMRNKDQLKTEVEVYRIVCGERGFPRCFDFFEEERARGALLEYMGPSIFDLWEYCNYEFSEKTMLMIGYQAIEILHKLHNHNYVHRDLKPSNFVVGRGQKSHHLCLIDFGLSEKFRNPDTLVPYRRFLATGFVGTPRYASINAHSGRPSRRNDDLESLGYVLLHFSSGHLPWSGQRIENPRLKYEAIVRKKNATDIVTLCKGASPILLDYMRYIMKINDDSCPDYEYLKDLFLARICFLGYAFDYKYDWCLK